MLSGLVFNIQKYSLRDGPGIRTTVFLKGCPLRCAWCHNPESQAIEREIALSPQRCIRCGACATVCPEYDRLIQRALPFVDRERCTRCGACVAVCASEARELVGRSMTAAEVLDVVIEDRLFYDESGGGMTLSGGEPLMQAEFAAAILQECRQAGVATAVDTCGFGPLEELLELARWTDLFLYDLKLMDDAQHRHWTGVSNRIILRNLEALAAQHANIWIRIPVVPGCNDAPEQLEQAVRFAASLPGVRQIHLLPFHDLAASKAERIGRRAPMPRVAAPSKETMTELAAALSRHGLPVLVGG